MTAMDTPQEMTVLQRAVHLYTTPLITLRRQHHHHQQLQQQEQENPHTTHEEEEEDRRAGYAEAAYTPTERRTRALNALLLNMQRRGTTSSTTATATDTTGSTNTMQSHKLAKVGTADKVTLLQVVRSLGLALTQPDEDVRAGATLLLAEILARLPQLPLSNTVISTLVHFLCARCKDHACTKEITYAVWALLKHHAPLPKDVIATTTQKSATTAIPMHDDDEGGLVSHKDQQQQASALQNTQSPLSLAVALFRAFGEDELPSTQSYPQSHRLRALSVVQLFLKHHLEDIIRTPENGGVGATNAVDAFVGAADGEKDPRNLVVVFDVALTMLKCFPASALEDEKHAAVEKIFDVTSCYFPITFEAAPNDPHGVTGPALRAALRAVMASHPRMAEFVLPLLLDKLSAAGISIKVDAWNTLAECIEAYSQSQEGMHSISVALPMLWHTFKRDLVGAGAAGADIELMQATQRALRAVVQFVCPDYVAGFATPHIVRNWDQFMGPLVRDCLGELQVPDAKLARAHASLLADVGRSSYNALARVVATTIPAVRERFFRVHASVFQRRALLELVSSLVNAVHAACVASPAYFGGDGARHPLAPDIASDVYTMCESLLSSEEGGLGVRLAAAEGAALLARAVLPGTLSVAQRRVLSHRTIQLVFDDECSVGVFKERAIDAYKVLASVSMDVAAGVIEAVLQYLEAKCLVADTCAEGNNMSDSSSQQRSHLERVERTAGWEQDSVVVKSIKTKTVVQAVNFVSCIAGVSVLCFDAVMPRLLSWVSLYLPPMMLQSCARDDRRACMRLVCRALPTVLQSDVAIRKRSEWCRREIFPVVLSSMIIAAAGQAGRDTNIAYGQDMLLHAGTVITCIDILKALAKLPSGQMTSPRAIVNMIVALFIDGNMAGVVHPVVAGEIVLEKFLPFSRGAPAPQLQLIPVFTALVGVTSVQQASGDGQLERGGDILRTLFDFIGRHQTVADSQDSTAHITRVAWVSAVQCLSSAILQTNTEECDAFASSQVTEMLVSIREVKECPDFVGGRDACDIGGAAGRILACFWILKALHMRPALSLFARNMSVDIMSLLNHAVSGVGLMAARGFGIVMMESDVVPSSSASALPMYKQRFFHMHALPIAKSLQTLRQERREMMKSRGSAGDAGVDDRKVRDAVQVADRTDVHMLALCAMAVQVPDAILKEHLGTLLDTFVQGLSSKMSDVRMFALRCLVRVIRMGGAQQVAVSSFLDALVIASADLCVDMQFDHAVRCDALEVIAILSKLPYDVVFPHKSTILGALDCAVDDPKRDVRRRAVLCRNSWSTLSNG